MSKTRTPAHLAKHFPVTVSRHDYGPPEVWPKARPADPDSVLSYILSLVGPERLTAAAQSVSSPSDAQELANRIAALLPAEDPLAEAIGPVYETRDLVEWTGKSRQALHQLARRHGVVTVKTSDGHTVYPAWQFAEDGTVLPGVGETLRALVPGNMSDWTNAMWFTGPSSDLDELSAAKWLQERRDPGRAVAAARRTAARWSQ